VKPGGTAGLGAKGSFVCAWFRKQQTGDVNKNAIVMPINAFKVDNLIRHCGRSSAVRAIDLERISMADIIILQLTD